MKKMEMETDENPPKENISSIDCNIIAMGFSLAGKSNALQKQYKVVEPKKNSKPKEYIKDKQK